MISKSVDSFVIYSNERILLRGQKNPKLNTPVNIELPVVRPHKAKMNTMVGWDICILEGNGFVRRLSTNGNMSVLVEN